MVKQHFYYNTFIIEEKTQYNDAITLYSDVNILKCLYLTNLKKMQSSNTKVEANSTAFLYAYEYTCVVIMHKFMQNTRIFMLLQVAPIRIKGFATQFYK